MKILKKISRLNTLILRMDNIFIKNEFEKILIQGTKEKAIKLKIKLNENIPG